MMDPVRLDGNLQQLAELVRGNSRRPLSATPESSRPKALPDSANRIANGLSGEVAPPLRDEDNIDPFMADLLLSISAAPTQSMDAQSGLRQNTVLALS
jgi:hypothetical protein